MYTGIGSWWHIRRGAATLLPAVSHTRAAAQPQTGAANGWGPQTLFDRSDVFHQALEDKYSK